MVKYMILLEELPIMTCPFLLQLDTRKQPNNGARENEMMLEAFPPKEKREDIHQYVVDFFSKCKFY